MTRRAAMARSAAKRAAKRRVDEEFRVPLAPPDACGAWRAAHGAAWVTEHPDVLESDAAGEMAAVALSTWLGRLAHQPPAFRAEYALCGAPVWDAVSAVIEDPQVAAIASRMATWGADDPDPALVQQLLAVLQVFEFRRLVGPCESAYRALLQLLPPVATRRPRLSATSGYVLANYARLLRTTGRLDEALAMMQDAQAVGSTASDDWLQARCLIGVAAIHEMRGNMPGACLAYEDAATRAGMLGDSGVPLVRGARHGLAVVAKLTGRYEDALRDTWAAFRGAGHDAGTRAEALCMLAEVCRYVRRPRAAFRAAKAALALAPHARIVLGIHATAVCAAEEIGEYEAADAFAATLGQLLKQPHMDPYVMADSHRDLAWWNLARSRRDTSALRRAREHAEFAEAIATRHGYHQITFSLTAVYDAIRATRMPQDPVALSVTACSIIEEAEELPLDATLLLTVG